MKIVSWNVNSIRARRDRVISWVEQHQPDVVLLQETKCDDPTFLGPEGLLDLSDHYEMAHYGRDHWNGVAVLSRVGLSDVQKGFSGINRSPFDEARLISASCQGLRLCSVYVPNGRSLDDPHYRFKLIWLERLRSEVTLSDIQMVAGDFNVAPADQDIYDPVRWRKRTHASGPERDAIRALLDLGLCDVTRSMRPEPGIFTWWSYRPGQFDQNRGLRIDLALCQSSITSSVSDVWIDTKERAGARPSDHAPLVVELDWETASTAT